MQMAPRPHGAPRFTGFGLVVLIHIVIVWALANGLIRTVMQKGPPPPVTLVEDKQTRVEPPVQLPKPVVSLRSVDPIVVPPPIFTESSVSPALVTTPQTSDNASTNHASDGFIVPAVPVQPPIAKPGPVTVGMVCTKTGKPEAPPLNWSGEAVFQVVGTVRDGRVVNVDFQSPRGAPMDARTRRALQAAISSTMRDTYECPGNHQFEQEFRFRIE